MTQPTLPQVPTGSRLEWANETHLRGEKTSKPAEGKQLRNLFKGGDAVNWLACPDLVGQKGQGLVEYGLILILIAVAIVVLAATMGNQIANLFSRVAAALD